MLPNVVAICERDDGSIWLVDAGFSTKTCADARGTLGLARVMTLGIQLAEGDSIASQMTRAGLDPARVTTIVATHLHFDHINGVADFPNAEVIAAREEWQAARASARLGAYRTHDLDLLARLRLLELQPLCVENLPRSAAIDHEFVVVDTAGHTAGHLGVLINDGERRWLHAGDCAYQMSELREGAVSLLGRALAHDMRRMRGSRERLRSIEHSGRLRLVLSHDAETFDRLPQLGGSRGELNP